MRAAEAVAVTEPDRPSTDSIHLQHVLNAVGWVKASDGSGRYLLAIPGTDVSRESHGFVVHKHTQILYEHTGQLPHDLEAAVRVGRYFRFDLHADPP
jgi:hypothetical protein